MIQSMHHIHEFTHHPIQTLIQDIFHDSFQDQSIIPSNIQSVTPSKMQLMIQSKIQPIVQSKIQSMIQVSCSGFCNHDLTMAKKWLLIWTLIWPWFLGQLFLMDRFLDGTFFTFGIEVISFAMRDEEDRVDPVIYIFPRMTKCTFHKFGTSGNIESHDALCILPINIVNEKIYVFLWFWFLILGSMTLLVVLYRLIIIFSPRMRAYLLFIRFRLIKKECINIIIKKTQMGDWFLLYMLGQNVDSMIFKEVIHELARRLGYSSKDLIDF